VWKEPIGGSHERSSALYAEAKRLTPGGVHSSIRYFHPYPIFIKSAKGSRLYDVDDNEYIDFHLAFGPVVLGHSHPKVTLAVKEQLEKGVIYGFSNDLEVKVASKIVTHVPSAEMVRFCNSGTEATYHAVRLSRAFTKRKKLVKFEGAYHGWHDLVSFSSAPSSREAGGRESPKPCPDTEGMSDVGKDIIIVPFNDPSTLEQAIKKNRNEIAAIITEPILHGNAACVPPREGFLKFLREITIENDIILIFDEVVTGFRHDLGGAQKLFQVTPDLTTFAKGMANGFPVGAVCGRSDMMLNFSPTGKVEYGGTFNGNPISMAAALATIEELEGGRIHEQLFSLGHRLMEQMHACIDDLDLKAKIVGFGSIFQLLFTDTEPQDYRDTWCCNSQDFEKYRRAMLENGVFLVPQFNKRCHISAAHTPDDIDYLTQKTKEILSATNP
jgi:glutamate-1-semialdehyde 2,1-aminomutase